MNKTLRAFTLGVVLAVPLGLLVAQSIPESRAGTGQWTCYVADRFPDMNEAAEWKGSKKITDGLNQVASDAPAGELLVLELSVSKAFASGSSGAPSVLCVKK